MGDERKLKDSNVGGKIVAGIGGGIILIVIFVLIGFFWGETTLDKIIAMLFALGALIDVIILFRIRNWGYLTHLFWMLFMFIRLYSGTTDKVWITIYVIALFLCVGLYFYLRITKRMKWRYREILELAAKPVSDATDGFTSRPFPAGQASFSKIDLNAFAKFLRRWQIALPVFEEDRVVFLVEITTWTFLFPKANYSKLTHVIFEYNGQISIQMSKKSYNQYKDELAFDKLCQSLARVFADFIELFRNGQKKEIIGRLNALKMGVMEE